MTIRASFPRKLVGGSGRTSFGAPRIKLDAIPLSQEERQVFQNLIENEKKPITSKATFWVPPRRRKSKTA